ncbi:MAG: glycosyltransferase [Acidobacteria bacterium]|nr:glycosyltransferase [Acidobacteriota bacterium]
MRNPLVSIIMPFYNAGDAFGPALRSIVRQSYTNWEMILCDDGSRDKSLEVALSIADPRILIWSDGSNKGLAGRLNECLDRARGTLIARMDADDISYPGRIERQVRFLMENPEVDMVGCRMLICGEDGRPLGKRRAPLSHEGIIATPAQGFGIAHPTWMARAGWYRKHRYDTTALRFEDAELLYRSHRESRFANLPEVLYGYREMAGGFQKRWWTRMGRIRYMSARKAELGQGTFLRAAFAEGVKVLLDAGVTAMNGRYAWLQRREEPLSEREIAEWSALQRSLVAAEGDFAPAAMAAKGATV